MVRNRTMMKSLHHKTFCNDTTRTSIANADVLLMFRRKGENTVPVVKDFGIMSYAGENQPPNDLLKYRGSGIVGDQKGNKFSQYIWRSYASSVWMDIRIDRVLPHRDAKEGEDELQWGRRFSASETARGATHGRCSTYERDFERLAYLSLTLVFNCYMQSLLPSCKRVTSASGHGGFCVTGPLENDSAEKNSTTQLAE